MTFADKLKDLRKSKNMSQEQLAEKIHISRQAVTKWETGAGLPDIENIIAIAALFNQSLDSLLSEEKSLFARRDFLYESRTQYDVDEEKQLDIRFETAHEVIIERTQKEKIEVLAASQKLNYLEQQVKVKIEEKSKLMDVTVKHSADLSDHAAKEYLFLFIRIPQKFAARIELSGITEILRIRDIAFDTLEFGGRFAKGFVSNASGHIELDTNRDLDVEVNEFKGKIDFNQIRASSVLRVKNGTYYLRQASRTSRFLNADNTVMETRRSPPRETISAETCTQYDFIAETAGWKNELKVVKE